LVASLVFGGGKLFIDGVAIVGRVHHIVEYAPIVEPTADFRK
jgi:hypothetical protein